MRRERLAATLERGIAALRPDLPGDLPVVMSGMASSNLGWQELPYASLPAEIDGHTLHCVDLPHAGRRVRLISGLRNETDVMRGEETELVGLFAHPARRGLSEDCTVILPGSHSKHVRLAAGRIVDFTTYLTGELFGLLARQSTLANSSEPEFDPGAFLEGVRASRTLGLSAALFQTRARFVLGNLPGSHSRAFLSGTLIGAELLTLYGSPKRPLVLAAGPDLAREYALALHELLPDSGFTEIDAADLA
ncbi:MAG: 2-dehydro-3-deoxygalactonokinase, partial [Opitutaceae bacterium]